MSPAASLAAEQESHVPKVLIIGDSISIGYTPHVQDMLEGKAEVIHHKGNAQHTGTGLKKLDAWLGDTDWDVIHFNWGLWDLCYRNTDSKNQGKRDKVNGQLTTSLEQYKKNLEALIIRLKATQAELIWASTTYVPEGEAGRRVGDEIKYNAVAKALMAKHGIAVNDLHATTQSYSPDLFIRPGDVHYTKEGYEKLGRQVSEMILETLEYENRSESEPEAITVSYEDFGAKGDGETDDLAAIVAAHAYANKHGLPVKANDNATYYIGGQDLTAIIQTDTDFGTAEFIIDDNRVENRKANIFEVSSKLEPINLQGIHSLKKNQRKISNPPPQLSLVIATNNRVKQFIRRGLNQNAGASQTDVFLVNKDGIVDESTPIIWNFDQLSEIVAYPIDSNTLKVSGGNFTTIANSEISVYNSFARGIAITRSNVILDGLTHHITGEGKQGAPYKGFLIISLCADISVLNTMLSGRKTYSTIGNAGKPVKMGSYGINVNSAINVSFINCIQLNDIHDNSRWGIMGSNYSKNLSYESCILSRFDAHKGVTNATIRNSILGHAGINAIGNDTFILENSTINSNHLINLRKDYGSTWQGDFIIRNCILVPYPDKQGSVTIINGSNDGQHYFGYTCYMPERIIIEGLLIDDSNLQNAYEGPTIFANFNPQANDESYHEDFPYAKTREVILKDVTTSSGKPLEISRNPYFFEDVLITTINQAQ